MTVRKVAATGGKYRSAVIASMLANPLPEIPYDVPKEARLGTPSVLLGCDPEFFLEGEEGIIGSEKVIGKKLGTNSHVVMDGVQVELNPPAGHCRETLASHISASFRALKAHLDKTGKVRANFTTQINLSQKELDSLSEDAKKLGCAPSINRADPKADVTIDGAKSLQRSAGGHIHLGLTSSYSGAAYKQEDKEKLVDVLDILVGNTCVLIDRDPNAAERRKVYGRAGEYRLPKHGLEYRVLSNFWLRAYPLFSFVMGISRNAVAVINHDLSAPYYKQMAETAVPKGYQPDYYQKQYMPYVWGAYDALMAQIGGPEGLRRCRVAINTNNWQLAKANFDRIKPFIKRFYSNGNTGFSPDMLENFETFVTTVYKKGIAAYFPQDPLEHWASGSIGGGNGWENFIRGSNFRGQALERIKALPNVKQPLKVVRKRTTASIEVAKAA